MQRSKKRLLAQQSVASQEAKQGIFRLRLNKKLKKHGGKYKPAEYTEGVA
jgi:hypothetical protein